MKHIASRMVILATSAAAIHLGGCVLVGFGVGAAIDSNAPDSVTVARESYVGLYPGRDFEYTDKQGHTRKVRLVRHVLESAATNRMDLFESLEDLDGELPPLTEDPVRVVVDGRNFPSAEFCGYAEDGVWLQFEYDRGPVRIVWKRIGGIRVTAGRVWTSDELRSLAERYYLPSRNGLIVRDPAKPQHAFLEGSSNMEEFVRSTDIVSIRVDNVSNNSWWWALGGFAADVVLFASLRYIL